MGKQHKPEKSTNQQDEITKLRIQNQRIAQEYQILFQQAQACKDLSVKNALSLSNIIRKITSRLLEIDVTKEAEEIKKQIYDIIKELNAFPKPSTPSEENDKGN